MILVDTSIWIDHLRRTDERLAGLLQDGLVLMHPFVVGEAALGNLPRTGTVLDDMAALRQVNVATDEEVLHFIEEHRLSGSGIGLVDAHLLASVRLTPPAALWTRDKRLRAIAERLRMSFRA